MNNWRQFLLCALWLFMPYYSFEQQPKWPRNPKTGKVELSGVLPWPVQASSLAQQQALVRNWYINKLTDDKSEKRVAGPDFTATGLSDLAYLDSTSNAQDKWNARSIRILYQVHLSYTPKGLAYQLSDFECIEIIFDASSSALLEEVLNNGESKELPKLAVFYRRLQLALSSW